MYVLVHTSCKRSAILTKWHFRDYENNGDVVALWMCPCIWSVTVAGTCRLSVSVRLRPNSFYVISPNRILISASYRSAAGKVTVVTATLRWQDDAEKTESRPITATSAASGNSKKKRKSTEGENNFMLRRLQPEGENRSEISGVVVVAVGSGGRWGSAVWSMSCFFSISSLSLNFICVSAHWAELLASVGSVPVLCLSITAFHHSGSNCDCSVHSFTLCGFAALRSHSGPVGNRVKLRRMNMGLRPTNPFTPPTSNHKTSL